MWGLHLLHFLGMTHLSTSIHGNFQAKVLEWGAIAFSVNVSYHYLKPTNGHYQYSGHKFCQNCFLLSVHCWGVNAFFSQFCSPISRWLTTGKHWPLLIRQGLQRVKLSALCGRSWGYPNITHRQFSLCYKLFSSGF